MRTPTITQVRKRDSAIRKEIAHLEHCRRMLKRADTDVYIAGVDVFESEEELAPWLCGGVLDVCVNQFDAVDADAD